VSILEKTYQLRLPGDTITYTVEKSAGGSAVNLDDGTITWTVKITAAKDTEPNPTPVGLDGYVFEDNLNGVGEYVNGSFSLTGGTLVIPDENSTKLMYTFPVGATSPQTLTFKTKIPPDKLTVGGDITNGAGLYLNGEEVGFDDSTVTITKPYVTKTGETNDTVSTSYDPTGRTITWYIKVDNEGRTLNSLTITDELKGGLIFDSAQWQKLETDGSTWADVTDVKWTSAPDGNQYVIGNINYVGRLKIVTKVPDSTDGAVIAKTYYNQASANWNGSGETSGSAVTGNPGVEIGYNALSKSGTQNAEDVINHQIIWKINVDMKGQTATDFKVYDLFVHDESTSDDDLKGAENWPSGLAIGSGNITRNNGQKFVEVSSNDSHLTVNSIELKKDGKTIATLIEISDLRKSDSNQVVLKSQVLDPGIIAGNDQSKKIYNYAALYKGSSYRGSANNYVNYNNKILAKELLKRAEVGNDHAAGTSIDANDRTIDVADGFHYGYKEVIFRLNINAAGVDFKSVETNLPEGFGDVVVTDTLPDGWEFVKFSGGQDYLIYETTGTMSTGNGFPSTGSMTASGDAIDSVSGLTAVFNKTGAPQTAAFTFKDLNKPYVILVKARPTDDTFDGYLKGDNARDETNTLSLNSTNWTPGESASQNVTVNSTVLEKTLDLSKQHQGILTWTVNYTPFGREIGTGLEDTLPQGIDLRTDSGGQLIWEGQDGSRNINVHALTLKDDGSGEHAEGAELNLDVLKSVISYDSNLRKLTFTFPDKTQAYKLTYVTDITGTPGTVTNAVKLVDTVGTGTSTNRSVTVSEQQGAATMDRSGYLVVKKEDMNSHLLPGAEFTLYNTNANGSKATSRAVRTTDSDGTVKFYGLAPGNYILVETKAPDDYENPSLEYHVAVGSDLKTTVNGSGIITSSNPFVVTNYKAADPVGSLTITKAVAGNDADATKAFQFTLTLDGATGTYPYVGQGVPGGTIASGDIFSLAHGQSITITGLPAGITYTVSEADYSGDRYTTVSTGATGSILTNTTQTASFTNTRNVPPSDPGYRTGTLTISKTVTGIGADTAKKFSFTVTFTGASGSYHYTGNGVPAGTIKSGDTVSLSNGQSLTITGLPAGSGYQVSEDEIVAQGYLVESIGNSGTISSSQDRTAAFVNTKLPDTTGSLTISKTVTGQGADLNKKFNFTLIFTDAPDAYPYTGASSGTLRSGDTISLANGESITITGLPKNAKYTVTEADYTGQGYTASSVGAAGVISVGTSQTASFTNKWSNVPGKPETPESPSDNIGDDNIQQGSMDNGKSGMPKTGDNQAGALAKLGLLFFSVAFVVLSAADFVLRKKYSGKRNRK
jgi:hypothetical protein